MILDVTFEEKNSAFGVTFEEQRDSLNVTFEDTQIIKVTENVYLKITQTSDGALIEATDSEGNTRALIAHGKDGKNGVPGKNGLDGYTPIKGEDYWTEDDKREMAQYAKDSIDIPKVPTIVSAFINDAGYLTEHQDLSGYARIENIPTHEYETWTFELEDGSIVTKTVVIE